MTSLKYGAGAGTQGTTLAAAPATGQLAAGETAFNTVTITAGATLIFDATVAPPAGIPFWLKFQAPATQLVTCRFTGLNRSIMRDSFYFSFDTNPTADRYVCTLSPVGGGTMARFLLAVSGGNVKLRAIDTRGTGTPVDTSSTTMLPNTTYRVDYEIGLGAGTAKFNWSLFLAHSQSALEVHTHSDANTGTVNNDAVIYGKGDSSSDTSNLRITGMQVNDSGTGLTGPWPLTPQTSVRPYSLTSSSGAWTTVGAGDMITALGDETDSSYIQSPNNPAGAFVDFDVLLLDSGIVDIPARLAGSAPSPTISATIELREIVGGVSTVRATRSYTISSTAFANLSPAFVLTQGESDSIVDRSQLHVRISAT